MQQGREGGSSARGQRMSDDDDPVSHAAMG
jgi:hypothetical protein